MKNTLAALSLASLFATPANAINLYSDGDTSINLTAELRLLAVAQEEEVGDRFFTKDDESRVTVDFENKGDLVSVLGTVQVRFDEGDGEGSNNTFTKLLFGGLKSDYGTLLGGRQYTFLDDADLQDVSYNFGDAITPGSDYDASVVKYLYNTDGYTAGFLFTIPSSGLDDSIKTQQGLIRTEVENADLQVIIGRDEEDIYFNADVAYKVDQLYFGLAVSYLDFKNSDAVTGYGVGIRYTLGASRVYGGYEATDAVATAVTEKDPSTWYLGGDYAVAKSSVVFVEFGEHYGANGMSLEVGLRAEF